MKKTVRTVAEAQVIIQQIAPASYRKDNSSLVVGAKAKDRIEWYNAENTSYCVVYENGEVDFINVFDADDEIIATIEIDNTAEDDGSNDDAEENFLDTLDTSIDKDNETEELVDEAEPVQEKIYTANWTLGYDNPRSDSKEFKTAVEAYKFLKKKIRRYKNTTYWHHYITVGGWDGKWIYEEGECGEKTTDPEIQALMDAADYEAEIKMSADEAKHFLNFILANYNITLEELFDFLVEYYEKTGTYFEYAGGRTARAKLSEWIATQKASLEIADYAVTPEAFEVAVQAEIDNANSIQFDLQTANNLEEAEKIFIAYVLRFDGWAYHYKGEKVFNSAVDAFNYLQKKHYKNDNWELVIEAWDSEEDYRTYSDGAAITEKHKIYTNGPDSDFDEYTTEPEIQKLIEERDAKAAADKIAEEKALAEEKKRKENLEQAEATCKALYDEWSAKKKKLADLRRYREQCKYAAKKAAYDLKIAELEEAFKPLDDKYHAAFKICLHDGNVTEDETQKPIDEKAVPTFDLQLMNNLPESEKNVSLYLNDVQFGTFGLSTKITKGYVSYRVDGVKMTKEKAEAEYWKRRNKAEEATVEYKMTAYIDELAVFPSILADLKADIAQIEKNLFNAEDEYDKDELTEKLGALNNSLDLEIEDNKHLRDALEQLKTKYPQVYVKVTESPALDNKEITITEFEVGKTYVYKDCFEEFTDFLKVMARFKDGADTYITVKDSNGNFHTFKVLFSDTWHKTDGNFRYIAEYITDSKRIYEAYSYEVKAES